MIDLGGKTSLEIFVKFFSLHKSAKKGLKPIGHTSNTFERQYLRNEAINHIAVFTLNNVILRGNRQTNKKKLANSPFNQFV